MEHGGSQTSYNLPLQERPTQVVAVEEEHTTRTQGIKWPMLLAES